MDFDDIDKKGAGSAGAGDEPTTGGGDSDNFGFDDETVAQQPLDEPTGLDFEDEAAASATVAASGGVKPTFTAPAGQTSFFGYFRQGLRIALLKGDVAEEVAADPGAFVPALLIYVFPSFLLGLVLFLLPGILFSAMIPGGDAAAAPPQFNAVMTLVTKVSAGFILILPLFALIGSLISVGIMHLLARLFKGEGRFLDYFQTVGVGSLVSWGGMIPFVGTLFSLWMLPVLVVITSRVHNLSTGRAVAVVLLPILVVVVGGIALFSAIMMLLMGTGGMQSM